MSNDQKKADRAKKIERDCRRTTEGMKQYTKTLRRIVRGDNK